MADNKDNNSDLDKISNNLENVDIQTNIKTAPKVFAKKPVVKTKLEPRPSRSMHVPIQKTFYGPKATLKKVTDEYLM
jgi:hypothetical protein